MAKYVSCDRVMEEADQVTFMGFRAVERKKHFMDLVSAILEACQKVDAVKVVRCQDCRYFNSAFGHCDNHGMAILPNEYCSYGERREEA